MMKPIKNKKTLASAAITLGIIATLILIQPMAGLELSFENLPSSCNVNQEINFKAKITIQNQEWSNISSIRLIISKDGKTDVVNIPINLNPNAVVVQNKALTNTSSEIVEIKVDPETNAVQGYGYGYDYINGSGYGYISYQTGYGYGYGYGYIAGYGYGYNVLNSQNSATISYDIDWKPESTGTYNIKLEVVVVKSDGSKVTFTKESSIYVSSTSSSTSSGGSYVYSGGGSKSSESTSSIVVASSSIMTQLQPGAVTNIPIPEDDAEKLGILGLMLEYNEKVKVKVELEKLSKLPSNVEPLKAFKFYNIVEIKVIDETTGKPIEPKGWIKFAVSKKWLESNGYDPDKVVMLRYHYKWEELHTEKTISDSENVYYKAYTPGFSIFAVAVPTEENATVNETTNTTTIITNTTTTESTTPTTSNENTAATSQQSATTSEKTTSSENTTTATETSGGSSWTLIVVGIIILIIIVAGAYFYMNKKNS